MRLRTALLAAATVVALAAPASAQNVNGFYIGGAGGAVFPQSVGGSYKPGNFNGGDTEFKTGYGLLGALGYGYGNGWRTELEAAYNKADIKRASVTSGVSTNGDVKTTSIMGNVLYDIGLGLPVTPYVGLGLGWMQLKSKFGASGTINNTAVGGTVIDGTSNLVGYQLIAGAALPLMDQLKLTLDYRFRSTFSKPEFDTTAATRAAVPTARSFESDRPMIHALMLGLRWEFGAPPPPARQALARQRVLCAGCRATGLEPTRAPPVGATTGKSPQPRRSRP